MTAKPADHTDQPASRFDFRAGIALSLCVLAFFAQVAAVNRYAVDIPYYDEWAFLHPDNVEYLTGDLDVGWLFQRHNEHRIPLTMLQMWLLYRLNGWDVASQQRMNLVLFAAVMAALAWALAHLRGRAPLWLAWAFLPLVASPVGYENHLWGFQSQFHLGLFALVVAVAALFSPAGGWPALAGGIAAGAMAVLSQSLGVAGLVGLIIAYGGYKLEQAFVAARTRHAHRRGTLWSRELTELTVGCLSLFVLMVVPALGYQRPKYHPPTSWPWNQSFWPFFLNEISLGFGLTTTRTEFAIPCIVAVLSPLILVVFGRSRVEARVRWGLAGLTLALLAALSSIAVGRAGLAIGAAKAPRYFQLAAALVPVSAIAWWLLLETQTNLRRAAVAGLALWCLLCSYDDWHFDRYRLEQSRRQAGLVAIQDYYQGRGDGRLSAHLTPWRDVHLQLNEARRLKISFTRGMSIAPAPEREAPIASVDP